MYCYGVWYHSSGPYRLPAPSLGIVAAANGVVNAPRVNVMLAMGCLGLVCVLRLMCAGVRLQALNASSLCATASGDSDKGLLEQGRRVSLGACLQVCVPHPLRLPPHAHTEIQPSHNVPFVCSSTHIHV